MFFPNCSTVIWGPPRPVAGAPWCFQPCHRRGWSPRHVIGAPMCSQYCHRRSLTFLRRSVTLRRCTQVLRGAPQVLSRTPRCSQTYPNHSHCTPVAVIRNSSYSEGQTEFPPTVWYSPVIDSSKFTLNILSDTPEGIQWLKYSLLMLRCFFLFFSIVVILALIPVDISVLQVKPTLPSVLYILHWFIIGLQCFFFLIRICIVVILPLIPIDITGSQVKPLKCSCSLLFLAGAEDGIVIVAFVTIILVVPVAPWNPEM